jgi:3-hydroxybutyryl-CoA dehydratase
VITSSTDTISSGDNNAVHINEYVAKTTPFKGRIGHGFLTAGTILD